MSTTSSSHRIIGAVIAGLVLLAALSPAPPAAAGVNVYTTPGQHHVNGRDWRTSCTQYSSNIRRCRTEIKSAGRWVFNNLTYLPAPRSHWGRNPLARNARWTAQDGRTWMTECGTPRTGRDGCRSYIWSAGRWVFNNIVMFGKVNASPTPGAGIWRPRGRLSWHVQYQGAPSTPGVAVFNLDGADTPEPRVAELHAAGARVVCYFNAGGTETWRSDFRSFPESVQGRPLGDWPGERWLDIRHLDALLPIMSARMDDCRDKGFDAVDPDNLDGYTHDTGFPLTQDHALAYQRALIELAHDRGLAIGLKNSLELVPELAQEVDFAVNEQCHQYQECEVYAPLLALGKPVFNIEYEGACPTQPDGMSTVLANPALDGATTSCH